ncbi:MAG: translocation/assembly module TamB domain-containing protein [Deltaproteobacteria bacterium]|nr:translocation/assembly module TamB domain-containing protein [Deltaproteobacteria bacterium]
MPSKKKKWRTVVFVSLAGLVFFLFSLHIVLNRQKTQKFLIAAANQHLDVALSADELHFNGATGHFSGKKLDLKIPRAHLSLSLDRFRVAISPFYLVFGKVHLADLQAEAITINIEALPQSDAKGPERAGRDLSKLLNNFSVDRAQIKNIAVTFPELQTLRIGKIGVKGRIPWLFYSRGLDITVSDIVYRSTRLDFFAGELEASGSFTVEYDPSAGKNRPGLDGRLRLNSFLLSAPKTPIPWNPAPAWDESLNPLLAEKYGERIPDNRAFVYIDSADLPFYFDPRRVGVDHGTVKAFGGKLEIDAEWDKKEERAVYHIENSIPFRLVLLPLGKAKFRQSFEKAGVEISGAGRLQSLASGDIPGMLKIRLFKNRIDPSKENLSLSAETGFRDGILNAKNIKITLADGTITGSGAIDLLKKTATSRFTGKNFDARTVVRFFSTIDIPGRADLSGGIAGSLANPTFDLTLTSPEAGYENLTFGSFNGRLVIRDKNLKLTGTTLLAGSGSGRIDLDITEVFRSSKQKVELKTDFKNLPLGPLLESAVVSGTLSGFFNMTKEKQTYDGRGNLEVSDILWYKVPIQRMTGQLGLKDKSLAVSGIRIIFDASQPVLAPSKPLVFRFDPDGYRFDGSVLPTVTVDGYRKTDDPEHLFFKLKAAKTPLGFLKPLVPIRIDQFSASGDFDVAYNLPSPIDSTVTADLSAFEFTGEEKNIRLTGKARVDFENRKIVFHNSPFAIGSGRVTLDGPLGIAEGSALRAKGSLDLAQLTGILPFLVEGEGMADIDLVWENSVFKPSFDGRIGFKNSSLFLRDLKRDLTEIDGSLKLKGNRYEFDRLALRYDDAPVALAGWIEWTPPRIASADLRLKGDEIPLSRPDAWRLFADADVSLRGTGGGLTLSGTLNVVEGSYYKDYSLSQFVLKPVGVVEMKEELIPEAFRDVNLDLKVKSAGEFEIRNNLADLALKSDIDLEGMASNPQASGHIDIVEGEIHAFGIDFENATGFAAFGRGRGLNPFIEFSASHEIQDYEIRAKLEGPMDNLQLSLESTPALGQNEIISLIAYGRTPDQLSAGDQNFFSRTAIASQIVGLLQRPLSKATHLDIVRLEAEYGKAEPILSRISVGKRLSPRFSVAFTTDLTLDEALKGIQVEYEIFDNILLKGIKDTGSRYRFDLTLRLQAY